MAIIGSFPVVAVCGYMCSEFLVDKNGGFWFSFLLLREVLLVLEREAAYMRIGRKVFY